jgi:hypothetical protein
MLLARPVGGLIENQTAGDLPSRLGNPYVGPIDALKETQTEISQARSSILLSS